MATHITTKSFAELSTHELYAILQLRSEVFVIEQDCVYQDMDGYDQDAIHVIAYDQGQIKGYTRLLHPNTRFKLASIGRMVVHASARKKGLARQIMQTSITYIFQAWDCTSIHLSAQKYLELFYGSLGFETTSGPYMEDGIPHVGMDLKKF